MNSTLLVKNTKELILSVRGKDVIIDSDLAGIFNVETKRLNEQVKRNIKKFPNDFMFQLTKEELDTLRSQFATSKRGGRRTLPYAFTKPGVL